MSNELKDILTYSQKLKVLFVEDNNDVRVQLLKVFENFFPNIDVEINGLNALEQYENYYKQNQRYYNLVITDLSMPKLDGIEFCKRIKEKNSKQMILVISAHTEGEKLKRLNEIGIYKFLQKPVDYRSLLNTLQTLILEIKESN